MMITYAIENSYWHSLNNNTFFKTPNVLAGKFGKQERLLGMYSKHHSFMEVIKTILGTVTGQHFMKSSAIWQDGIIKVLEVNRYES